MVEYISREAAIAARKRSCDQNCAECDFAINGDSWCNGEVFVVDLLRIPAADVRPVVLCRYCLHYEMGVCLKIYDDGAANKDAWQDRKPDDFCSYGEKREES